MNNSELKNDIQGFVKNLLLEEKSRETAKKYLHDLYFFADFLGERQIEKLVLLEYKEYLYEKYAVTSANSMIAALNSYLKFCGRSELLLKQFKIQRDAYCDESRELTKEEYLRLVNCAKRRGRERICLILQTICSTGIRVSELKFITVEALKKGEATVNCKGKHRRVFIVNDLKRKLLRYSMSRGIVSGSVFVTRNGNPITRFNVWKDMKALCREAGVCESKVFPHNLRHLFARTFYRIEHDVVKLADILGHSSIDTTRIYTVTSGSEHRRRMENMHLII